MASCIMVPVPIYGGASGPTASWAQPSTGATTPAVMTRAMWGRIEGSSTMSSSDISGGQNERLFLGLDAVKKEKKKGIVNRRIARGEHPLQSSSDYTSSEDKHASEGEGDARVMNQLGSAASNQDAVPVANSPEVEKALEKGLPSAGSVNHEAGTCKPCLFLYQNIGCKADASCPFCHLPHNRKTLARQSKGKRDRFRKLLSKLEAEGELPPPKEPVATGRVRQPDEGQETTGAPQPRVKNIMSL